MSHVAFLLLHLEFEGTNKNRDLTKTFLKNNITFALKNLFGEVGAAIPFSVLKLSDTGEAILSCPAQSVVKLRSSLTLQGTFQGENCCYSVKQEARSLLQLSRN